MKDKKNIFNDYSHKKLPERLKRAFKAKKLQKLYDRFNLSRVDKVIGGSDSKKTCWAYFEGKFAFFRMILKALSNSKMKGIISAWSFDF